MAKPRSLAIKPQQSHDDAPPPPEPRGRKFSSIRWTVEQAAREFEIDRRTLAKNLIAIDALPADDGRFSTGQITTAVFGDLEREKIRRERADADLAEMKRDEKRRDLVPFAFVEQTWSAVIAALRQEILAAKLMPDLEKRLLGNLRNLTAHDYAPRPRAD